MAGSDHHVLGRKAVKYKFPQGAFGYSGSDLPGIMRAIRFPYRFASRSNWPEGIGDVEDWFYAVQLCRQILPPTRCDEELPPFCFPDQNLTFVARVLKRIKIPPKDKLEAYLSWVTRYHDHSEIPSVPNLPEKDVLVCTPLYVALSNQQ